MGNLSWCSKFVFVCFYLESPHVPGISGVLEAVLVALQEKLHLAPTGNEKDKTIKFGKCVFVILFWSE
jgi:hypothetical protein